MMINPLPSSWIAMNSWELRKSIHSTVALGLPCGNLLLPIQGFEVTFE